MSHNKWRLYIENQNKIIRLTTQSATSNWLETYQKQKKTRIPIEDIYADWKTNVGKTNKISKFIIKQASVQPITIFLKARKSPSRFSEADPLTSAGCACLC